MMKKIIKRTILAFLLLLLILISYIAYLVYVGGNISEGEQIAAYPETKTALLVIDVQEGTTGKHSAYPGFIDQAKNLIEVINNLSTVSQQSGVLIVYIKQETENFTVNFLTNNALAKGTPNAEIDDRVDILSKHIFSKQVQDPFSNPELDKFLVANQINRLLITGLDINGCAGAAIDAALKRAYEVLVVEDGVISETEEAKKEKLAELRSDGIQILTANAVVEMLSK